LNALLKWYVEERDSTRYNSILGSDEAWLTCRITWVEVWRNLGRRLTTADAPTARDASKPTGHAWPWSRSTLCSRTRRAGSPT